MSAVGIQPSQLSSVVVVFMHIVIIHPSSWSFYMILIYSHHFQSHHRSSSLLSSQFRDHNSRHSFGSHESRQASRHEKKRREKLQPLGGTWICQVNNWLYRVTNRWHRQKDVNMRFHSANISLFSKRLKAPDNQMAVVKTYTYPQPFDRNTSTVKHLYSSQTCFPTRSCTIVVGKSEEFWVLEEKMPGECFHTHSWQSIWCFDAFWYVLIRFWHTIRWQFSSAYPR